VPKPRIPGSGSDNRGLKKSSVNDSDVEIGRNPNEGRGRTGWINCKEPGTPSSNRKSRKKSAKEQSNGSGISENGAGEKEHSPVKSTAALALRDLTHGKTAGSKPRYNEESKKKRKGRRTSSESGRKNSDKMQNGRREKNASVSSVPKGKERTRKKSENRQTYNERGRKSYEEMPKSGPKNDRNDPGAKEGNGGIKNGNAAKSSASNKSGTVKRPR
jgi:hypothetical protein